jgi:hypothetical protein
MKADGGGWRAILLGAALAAPWLSSFGGTVRPPVGHPAEPVTPVATGNDVRMRSWLKELGVSAEDVITLPGNPPIKVVPYCRASDSGAVQPAVRNAWQVARLDGLKL